MNCVRICSRVLPTIKSRGMGWAAVCQMTSTNDIQENMKQATELISGAAGRGAQVVFLPEAHDLIGESGAQTLQLSQSLGGTVISEFQRLAQTHRVWLSLGGFHHKCRPEDPKIQNTHVVINDTGHIVETYVKAHLFDVEIPGKFKLMESDYVEAGSVVPPPVSTPIGRLGLGICYDLRFPELSIGLRALGAEILSFPSSFTVPTGMAHWKPLLQARAIENQCYVVAAAQTGKHNSKRSSYGHAMIVDPWGTVVAECREGISFALAEIDLDYLRSIRSNMPVNLQRRPDLYGAVALTTASADLPEDDWVFQFGPARVLGHSVVYRTGLSVMFVNKKPVVPGHLLVSPLRSVSSLVDLSTAEVTDLFSLVQKAERFLLQQYNTNSCTVSIQDGPAAGQTIPHLHVHMLPRREGDFRDNDDIYRELENHDKAETGWKDELQMKAEADIFRLAWKNIGP